MTRKPLSNVDTAWLRMEEPDNLMMISGVLVFGAPMEFERLKATLEHGFLRFDRFRQLAVQPPLSGGRFFWQDDPDFDFNYHLQRATLPPPCDQAALQELASLLASTQLDFSKPLWQFHLVENYEDGCALICRLHHSIGDGMALVNVLLSLTSPVPDSPWPLLEPQSRRRPRRAPLGALLRPARTATKAARRVTGMLVHEGLEMFRNPSRAMELASLGTRGAFSLGRLLLLWPDPKTVFKGPLGVSKRAAWSQAIPLQDVKTIGRGLGGTVNDVLLTAMAGALRRYLQGRGEPVDGLNFRAVVPVDLRPPGIEPDLGNKFGLVFVSLPVGIAEPADRLFELKRRMDALKGSLEAPVAFGILNAIGMAPEPVQDVVVNIFGMKGTAVMTNVIGPREPIYLAGAPLKALMFWVPQSGRLGLGVSILSYAGRVWMGLITDEGLVPDPETIIAAFHNEFGELLALTSAMARSRGVQKAVTQLDATSQSEAAESGGGVPERCQALTKAGQPCRNRPLGDSCYCRVHQQ